MAESATNILSNAVLPVDPRKMQLLFGSAEYITVEVLVSAMVRKFMGASKPWTDLILIHTISLPFMGGAVGFMDPPGQMNAGWIDHFMSGAKGIPAVLIAEWIWNTFAKGFHVPWFNMKDLLITAGAKTISRPITGAFYGYLPKNAADALAVVNAMIGRQNNASSIKPKG